MNYLPFVLVPMKACCQCECAKWKIAWNWSITFRDARVARQWLPPWPSAAACVWLHIVTAHDWWMDGGGNDIHIVAEIIDGWSTSTTPYVDSNRWIDGDGAKCESLLQKSLSQSISSWGGSSSSSVHRLMVIADYLSLLYRQPVIVRCGRMDRQTDSLVGGCGYITWLSYCDRLFSFCFCLARAVSCLLERTSGWRRMKCLHVMKWICQ